MGRLAMAATVADSTFGLKLEDRFRALDQLYRLNKEQQKERRTTRARF